MNVATDFPPAGEQLYNLKVQQWRKHLISSHPGKLVRLGLVPMIMNALHQNGQVKNAEVRKRKYGNGSTETEVRK